MADPIADVRQALRTKLLAIPGIPAKQKLEGYEFEKENGVEWIEEKLTPASEKPITMGPGAYIRHSGIYTVKVYVPVGKGSGRLDLIAGLIRNTFQPDGTGPLVEGGQSINIEFAQRGGASRDRDDLVATVTISWNSVTIGA